MKIRLKTIFKTKYNEIEYKVDHARHLLSGYGYKNIHVEIFSCGEIKTFKAKTSNMHDFDRITDRSDGQSENEYYEALFGLVKSQLEEQIEEWASELKRG